MNTPPEATDRVPPSDIEAEKFLLGSLLLDPARLTAIAGTVRAEDFYSPANGILFSTMLELQADGVFDFELLLRKLKADSNLATIGGHAYLAEVAKSTPTVAHAGQYAAIVAEKAKRRAVVEAGRELVRSGSDEDTEVSTLLDAAGGTLASVEMVSYTGTPTTALEAAQVAMLRVYEAKNTGKPMGLPTGLVTFDHPFGGLFNGELIILAARTSVGKTALACQIAYHNARRGNPVYFASLEMADYELATRIMCGESGVDSRRVRAANVNQQDVDRLSKAASNWVDLSLWIHDRPGITVPEICRWARRYSREGLRLVVVDYLQLLSPVDGTVQRHLQIAEMTKALKALARELEIPVLVLAQLSRAADHDDKAEPRLSHFRESGAIEQDADMALILWKRPADQGDGETQTVRLVCKKNRNGPVGFVSLNWTPTRTRFDCGEIEPPDNYDESLGEYGGGEF